MDWNLKDEVQSYQEWYDTPEGSFALRQEQALIEQLILHWPRRNHSLLEVGCGPGIFLEKFWEAGLDVSGLDSSEAMLDLARKRLGNRAELQLGVAEHLPFDDDTFDYVALINVLEFVENPEVAIKEAYRVAAKGLLLGFLNPWSLRGLSCQGNPLGNPQATPLVTPLVKSEETPSAQKQPAHKIHSFNPLKIRSMLRNLGDCQHLVMRSVLLGPQSTWGEKRFWSKLNSWILPLPLGAFAAARADLYPSPNLRPLWLTNSLHSLKYSNESLNNPQSCGRNLRDDVK